MKKNLLKKLLFFTLLFASTLLKAQSGYTIKLEMTGFKDSTRFYLVNLDLMRAVDSVYIRNGRLAFTGKTTGVVTYRVHTTDGKYVILYLENKSITIKGSYADFYYSEIEGSEINNYWVKSRNWQRNYQAERDSLSRILFSAEGEHSPLRKQMIARVNTIDSTVTKYRLDFIRTEKPTYFTLHELYFIRNDLHRDTLKSLFNKFPKTLRDLKAGEVIQAYITHQAPAVGTHFIDIEGIDTAGVKHKLSDFSGKYVLLDFWASWCGPCRQENPVTLKAYNLYKVKGFEVFGYSTDSNKDSWMKAIKTDHLNWLNVSDLKGSYSQGAASYQVRSIPQNFLIAPDGIIIAKNLRGDDLEKKLKDIFKE